MTLPLKRKRQGRTDYKKRLHLLVARTVRLVVRKSRKNILLQLVDFAPAGDRILVSAHSRELVKYGWTAARMNIPSAYLTGLLLGRKAKEKKISTAVLDAGRAAVGKGSVIASALKGAVDAGLAVPHDAAIFPPPERLEGQHLIKSTVLAPGSASSAVKKVRQQLIPKEVTAHAQ